MRGINHAKRDEIAIAMKSWSQPKVNVRHRRRYIRRHSRHINPSQDGFHLNVSSDLFRLWRISFISRYGDLIRPWFFLF
ncbi:MAG: hypothetical protein IJZ21_03160 [Clostridia bacterium]|nr:hypothetical protein [Clostridia bacterium]